MKTPPAGFVRTLRSYNRDLRVRWSFEKGQWIIECKSPNRLGLLKPVRYSKGENGEIIEHTLPELSDLYIGWRDCYYSVCWIKSCTTRILNRLAAADTQHFKNHELIKTVEEQDAKSEARTERIRRDESHAHSNEVYDYLNNRGSRAFPGGTSL